MPLRTPSDTPDSFDAELRSLAASTDLDTILPALERRVAELWEMTQHASAVGDAARVRAAMEELDALELLGQQAREAQDGDALRELLLGHVDRAPEPAETASAPPPARMQRRAPAEDFPEQIVHAHVRTHVERFGELRRLLESEDDAASFPAAVVAARARLDAELRDMDTRTGVYAVAEQLLVLTNTRDGLELLRACDRTSLFNLRNPVVVMGMMAADSVSAINDRARLGTWRLLVGADGVGSEDDLRTLLLGVEALELPQPEVRRMQSAMAGELLSVAMKETMEEADMTLTINPDLIRQTQDTLDLDALAVARAIGYGAHEELFTDLSPAVDQVLSAVRDVDGALYQETIETLLGRAMSVERGSWASYIMARFSDSTTRFEGAAKDLFEELGISTNGVLHTRYLRRAVLSALKERREIAEASGVPLQLTGEALPEDWERQLEDLQ